MEIWLKEETGRFKADLLRDDPWLRQLIKNSLGLSRRHFFESEYDLILREASKYGITLVVPITKEIE